VRQALAGIAAQIGAEMRTRLRSVGTIFTVLLLFAAAFTYLPAPDAHRVSFSWQSAGRTWTGAYSAGFIGATVAMLTGLLLPLIGFYLVTGSVQRDLRQRVWPIVAATPTPPAAYLLGKWLAGFAYLLVCAALGLVPAVILFFRYGTGAFSPGQLLLPWLLVVPPAMAFTTSMALLFDVTPGLRGRGGLVLWFFVWACGFMMIPAALGNLMDQDSGNDRVPAYDPGGLVFFHDWITHSLGRPVDGISMGVIFTDEVIQRVPLPPLRLTARAAGARAASAAWAVLPLALAMAVFRLGQARALRPPRARRRARETLTAAWHPDAAAAVALARERTTAPGFARSVLAEALLLWSTASWLKWLLPVTAVVTALAPAPVGGGFLAAFLLLLAPVIAECAARERLEGTAATVFSQPGVPRSVVLWKLGATGGFVALLAAPAVVRAFASGPAAGLALLLGMVFVATTAVGLGWLSRGGRLFLGAYTALWYMAVQKSSPVDFTGAFGGVHLARSAVFAGIGCALVLAAAAVEAARAQRG
jgi:hypothetical protein